jgi:TRAP-type mannitol/chloroaromatic compound transport system permease small subunit
MELSARLCAWIDALNERVGRAISWLTAGTVALMFAIVVWRYAFARGSVALQEATLWMHSAVFMLGAAFALKRDAHVRVDVLYQRLSARGKAICDMLGTVLFLLPFAAFLVYVSWDYVAASWSLREGSKEPGGLPGVFVLKTLIPLCGALLALQGIANALRAAMRWRTSE